MSMNSFKELILALIIVSSVLLNIGKFLILWLVMSFIFNGDDMLNIDNNDFN